ncbi:MULTISPECIES: CdaR family protein [Enterococcus]|uniref:CdaR family protein n=1 Tax=Enterococcus TaxID=1350 RepID=UPI001484D6BB|nr:MULTISPECIES: CdaR family protein [Enterococcus]KAF1300141.1 hypothetical protein BAU16_12915 [Enterococcus sp. JM9B]
MISKESKSSVFYAIVSLLFSVVLFFNVNGNNNLTASLTSTPEAYEETVTNVPVHPVYDSSEYYIHGYEPTVKVKLRSANRIQLNSEVNEDTRGFRVVADLSNLEEGTHEVKLRINKLSSAVTATVDPGTITVTIEKKVSKTFKVEPVVSTANLEDGFQLESATVSPKEVTITTGDKTAELINRVVATVDPEKVTSKDFEETVAVQALDEKGNSLSILSDPVEVNVKVSLTAPEKTVGLYVTQQGRIPSGVSGYTFTLAQQTAVLQGPLSQIDLIDSIAIPVDISGINQTTTRTIDIPVEDGLGLTPAKVSVEITPTLIQSSSESSGASETVPSQQEESAQSTTEESSTTQSTTTENSQTNESGNDDN